MNTLLLVGVLLAVAPVGPKTSEEASIDDFAWLAGHWLGEGFGGQVEEVWSRPLAGAMVGTFRIVKEARVELYEIVLLERDADGFVLRVKHFSGAFEAWEEKADSVDFRLESVEENSAIFNGLTFRRDGDSLEIRIRMKSEDGSKRWETLSYRAYQP